MTAQRSLSNSVLLVGIFLAIVFFMFAMLPVRVYAQNTATGANAKCAMWNPQCPCGRGTYKDPTTGQCPGSGNTAGCSVGICQNTTSGVTTQGICDAPNHCKAVTSGGSPVDQALGMLGQLLSQALQKLMSGGGGGGGSPPGSGAGGNMGIGNTAGIGQTCTSYRQTTTPSSNPCEYYVPTGNSTVATDLLNSLNGTGTQTGTTGVQTQGTSGNSGVGALVNPDGSAATPDSFSSFANVAGLAPGQNPNQAAGPQGDIQLGPNGATIYASNNVTGSNIITSGFFGADTLGGVQSQGVAAWLCTIRPWKNAFLSNLIPDAFFDGLCSWRGFHVGPLPHPAVPVLTQTPVIKSAPIAPMATSTGPVVSPKVQIWAVPASVSIGSRTSVFWTTQGVSNCTETSPDGSFNQTSLSGGASTVPLTSATTYTISCFAPDGTPVTDYFTVHMAI